MLRTARRTGTSAWRWSAGSPPRRLGVFGGSLLLLGLLAFAWWPDARVSPYRPGETGTFQQQVRELKTVGQGSPLLRAPNDAQTPLAPVAPGHSAVLDRTGAATTGSAGTNDSGSTAPAPSSAPDGGTAPVPASSPAGTGSAPSPDPATSTEPAPSPSG